MRIPKKFRRIADKRPCHTVAVIYDGDIQIIIYKQWSSFKKYWVYRAIEGDSLYRELYYKRYNKFPSKEVVDRDVKKMGKP